MTCQFGTIPSFKKQTVKPLGTQLYFLCPFRQHGHSSWWADQFSTFSSRLFDALWNSVIHPNRTTTSAHCGLISCLKKKERRKEGRKNTTTMKQLLQTNQTHSIPSASISSFHYLCDLRISCFLATMWPNGLDVMKERDRVVYSSVNSMLPSCGCWSNKHTVSH